MDIFNLWVWFWLLTGPEIPWTHETIYPYKAHDLYGEALEIQGLAICGPQRLETCWHYEGPRVHAFVHCVPKTPGKWLLPPAKTRRCKSCGQEILSSPKEPTERSDK